MEVSTPPAWTKVLHKYYRTGMSGLPVVVIIVPPSGVLIQHPCLDCIGTKRAAGRVLSERSERKTDIAVFLCGVKRLRLTPSVRQGSLTARK